MYELRFFFDAGSGICLWSKNDAAREKFGYPVQLAELPISESLAHDLDALIGEYDTFLDWSDPAGPSPRSKDEWDAFHRCADALLNRLITELGDDFLLIDQRTVSWSD